MVAHVTRRRVLQVVTLPYNLLLHRDAREALGIDLINQVVVVDEAHSEYFTMTLRKPYEFARSHIVFTFVIYCDAPTRYS